MNDCVLVHIEFRASSEKMGFFILEVSGTETTNVRKGDCDEISTLNDEIYFYGCEAYLVKQRNFNPRSFEFKSQDTHQISSTLMARGQTVNLL